MRPSRSEYTLASSSPLTPPSLRTRPSTVAKAYRLLSALATTAVIDRLIARSPCVEKGAGVERAAEIRVATPDQVAAIAAAKFTRPDPEWFVFTVGLLAEVSYTSALAGVAPITG
ncbi:MAG: hypothetical protein QOI47_2461 [Actinomycetota bacterium]|nr:hypothetical protein [Actinomycetota bacterium]